MPVLHPASHIDVADGLEGFGTDAFWSPLFYAELKALAAHAMRGERDGHTLQTTALVNEAWMRMTAQHGIDPDNRAQLLCIASRMMRRVLVDHARRRMASKRPFSEIRVAIEEIDLPVATAGFLDLDGVLERLARINARQAQVIDLKFFAGLELDEIADVLGVARATIVRDWLMARAWLQRELADG